MKWVNRQVAGAVLGERSKAVAPMFEALKELSGEVEHAMFMFLDKDFKVVGDGVLVAESQAEKSDMVMFDSKEVIAEGERLGAKWVIAAHNHPSYPDMGDRSFLTPSPEDMISARGLAEEFNQRGMVLSMALVLGKNGDFSDTMDTMHWCEAVLKYPPNQVRMMSALGVL
jgi:DNA repair protein RadC